MSAQASRLGPLFVVAAVVGYLLGGCGGDGSGLPSLSSLTLPTGSVTLPTRPSPTETSPGTTSGSPTTVTESTTTTQPETTTEIETVTTDTEPTTESTTTEVETETTDTAPTEPLTTTTVPTDTSGGSSEDDSAWAVLALGVALGALRDPETPTTTSQAPATTTPPTPDMSPAETVAAEPTSSEDDTPWGWIALGLGLVLAAAIAGVVIWRRKRRGPPGSDSHESDPAGERF